MKIHPNYILTDKGFQKVSRRRVLVLIDKETKEIIRSASNQEYWAYHEANDKRLDDTKSVECIWIYEPM